MGAVPSDADVRSGWNSNILDSNISPVDLSFLNAPERPAGKRGFLRVRGDKLVFDDQTPARFWGTNVTAYSLFGSSKDTVRRQAHRLSQLGFNLVRIHHHDSEWVDPNIFGARSTRDTLTLNAAMLEKLDWWIKCLKDEGIYVWLDLQVDRRVKAADGIEGFEEIRRGKPTASLSGYNFVNPSIGEAMKRFNDLYLNHVNGFTGLRYKDDAAIVAVLISNENDLTHHFGNALLPDKHVPLHSKIYMQEATRFAAKYGLPQDKVWRAWEDGPSKLFLNDLEQRFYTEMIGHLRTIGVKTPIIPTSTWGLAPLSSLPALTVGGIIDVHSYGGAGELAKNPNIAPNLVSWIAAAQVVGRPLSVTEWGLDAQGYPASDRQDMPLYVAASGAMQGWDAIMFYAYSQEALNGGPGSPSVYQAYNDPAMMATLPAAALLYRRSHVREASTTYVFAPSREMLFAQSISPATSIALRTASERGKLLIAMPRVAELPWLAESTMPVGAKILRDPQEGQIPIDASKADSDTGELSRDWAKDTFSINTPCSQAVMGRIGGATISLPQVEIAVSNNDAAVAVQSLDGLPIEHSRNIMISVGARSVPNPNSSMPYYSEPVEGKVFIKAPSGLQLQVSDVQTDKVRSIREPYIGGRYVVTLDRSLRSSWLSLKPTDCSAADCTSDK